MNAVISYPNNNFIAKEDELSYSSSQNDFMVSNYPPQSNYNFQPIRGLPYLKDHQNVVSLSKNICNNNEPSLIDRQKEIKIEESFFNFQDL